LREAKLAQLSGKIPALIRNPFNKNNRINFCGYKYKKQILKNQTD